MYKGPGHTTEVCPRSRNSTHACASWEFGHRDTIRQGRGKGDRGGEIGQTDLFTGKDLFFYSGGKTEATQQVCLASS